jgi:hypothetical protein
MLAPNLILAFLNPLGVGIVLLGLPAFLLLAILILRSIFK